MHEMSTPTRDAHLRSLLAGLGLLALALGCDGAGPRPIVESRTATVPSRPAGPPGITSEDRFSFTGHGAPRGGDGSVAPPPAADLALDAPDGWEQRPDPSGMRLASFGFRSSPDGDCSVTVLPGAPSAIAANVDRWRGQLGLGPLEPGAEAKLPPIDFLGGRGLLVDLEGAYSGMGGSEARAGWKLLGAIRALSLPRGPSLVFVKMVGPAATVDAERKAFLALCGSLRPGAAAGGGPDPHAAHDPNDPHADHTGHQHGDAPAAGAGEGPLRWKAPEGWAAGQAAPARLVTFKIGPARETECYVAVLGGSGGGVVMNVNRWRDQMGQPPLADDAVAALPRLSLLGQEAPIIEAAGTFTDMQGQKRGGAMLLGTMCRIEEVTLFVKMVGPEAQVRAERERFLAFCSSLERTRP